MSAIARRAPKPPAPNISKPQPPLRYAAADISALPHRRRGLLMPPPGQLAAAAEIRQAGATAADYAMSAPSQPSTSRFSAFAAAASELPPRHATEPVYAASMAGFST
jgi:hypothetical protein